MAHEYEDTMTLSEAKLVAKTDGAVLVEHEMLEDITPERDRWIPWSQVDDASEITRGSEKGDIGDLTITMWIADKKGLA